jgi:uncharacterized protein involved in type VI secretion and phage assembly
MSAAAPAVQRFYGKYRGTVVNNIDPMQMGRVQVLVPDVSGDLPASWAMPCVPVAGINSGVFTLPPVGSGVWIEFEHGDPDYPIWSGCWWGGQSEMPSKLLSPPPPSKKLMLITEGGHSVLLDDTAGSGGITLQTSGGAKIVLGDQGIEIDNGKGGKVKLSGSQVSINDGALEVS